MDVFSSLREFLRRAVIFLSHPHELFIHGCKYILLYVRLRSYGRTQQRHYPQREVGVFPQKPFPFYILWGVSQVLGLKLVKAKRPVSIMWYDATHIPQHKLAGLTLDHYINGRCLDISKSNVSQKFETVFGYPIHVDPRTHIGPMVQKSELNGSHSGRIVTGPISKPSEHNTYQSLIDNTTKEGGKVLDLRVTIVGKQIPLVLKKTRPVVRRFEGGSRKTEITNAEQVFSQQEIELLLTFAHKIGVDFGELDVLRDNQDGKIYVVDVNKTCVSPPIEMPLDEHIAALKIVAEAFEREFLRSQ